MNNKEVDKRINEYNTVGFDNSSSQMFSAAERQNIKFKYIWYVLSPLLKVIANNLLVKVFKPSWIKFINDIIKEVDAIEEA